MDANFMDFTALEPTTTFRAGHVPGLMEIDLTAREATHLARLSNHLWKRSAALFGMNRSEENLRTRFNQRRVRYALLNVETGEAHPWNEYHVSSNLRYSEIDINDPRAASVKAHLIEQGMIAPDKPTAPAKTAKAES